MARYSKIGVQIWGDERFCRLSKPRPNAQTLWFFLLANPARTALPGLINAGQLSLAEGLGWSLAAFRRCWNEIEAEKMASADWAKRVVWIPKMVRWDPPNGPNVAKAWGRNLKQLPECQLRCQAEAFIDAFLNDKGDAIHKAFRDGIGDSVRISNSHLPSTDIHLPQPSPTPSPPGHREEGENGREHEAQIRASSHKNGNGGSTQSEDEFYARKTDKLRELVKKHGHPLNSAGLSELTNWVHAYRSEHGLEADL